MAGYRLSPAAEADLSDIWDYTATAWGVGQARTYLLKISAAVEMLAEHPARGRSAEKIRAAYKKYPVGSHVIFYKPLDGGIDVVRILHQRMDVTRHLR